MCVVKKTAFAVVIIIAAALVAFLICDGTLNKEISSGFFSMNTYSTVKLKGTESDKAAEEIQKLTEKLDTEILSRKSDDSVVSHLNKNGGGNAENLSDYLDILFDVCQKAAAHLILLSAQ